MRIAFVEDEEPARQRLEQLLRQELPDAQLRHFAHVDPALEFLETNEIDLLFLDLDVNQRVGFEILQRFDDLAFHTIIVSGHIDQAIKAFEYGVVDFLPKPVTAATLRRALDRVRALEKKTVPAVTVKSRGELHVLNSAELQYIEKSGPRTRFVAQSETRESRQGLAELLKQLPPHFRQIHKSFIVNCKEIQTLEAESGGRYGAVLRNGETLPVGRRFYKDLRQALGL